MVGNFKKKIINERYHTWPQIISTHVMFLFCPLHFFFFYIFSHSCFFLKLTIFFCFVSMCDSSSIRDKSICWLVGWSVGRSVGLSHTSFIRIDMSQPPQLPQPTQLPQPHKHHNHYNQYNHQNHHRHSVCSMQSQFFMSCLKY